MYILQSDTVKLFKRYLKGLKLLVMSYKLFSLDMEMAHSFCRFVIIYFNLLVR